MSLLGHEVPRDRATALARVGAIVDEPRFHGHLTGRQNLQHPRRGARARGDGPHRRPRSSASGSCHRADDKVTKYSMGMRQRLGVAACLIGDPQLLILDEPMNGLDPAGMQDMREMILSLVAEGRTVVLSSHLLDEVERTCDAVAIVDHGQGHPPGPITELLQGTSLALEVDCAEPERARSLLAGQRSVPRVDVSAHGLARHDARRHATRRRRRGQPACSSRVGSRCTASRRSRRRSSRGSFGHEPTGRTGVTTVHARSRPSAPPTPSPGPPGIVDPDAAR